MKFLVDAQLPKQLCKWISVQGYDCKHAMSLPNREFTSDLEITEIATKEERIVITKDSDFLKFYLIKGVPKKLLLITTGNIRNKELLDLCYANFPDIINHFDIGANVIEFSRTDLLIHK